MEQMAKPIGRNASESACQLWDNVLQVLRVRLRPEAFETWFSSTQGVGICNGNLVVRVPHPFSADWISHHYGAEIRTILSSLSAENTTVSFVATEQAPRAVAPTRPLPSIPPQGFAQGRLQLRYTFENFVVGECNRLAYAAARSVAENPGSSYNPLFVYGGVGLGKTHLLQAIGNYRLTKLNSARIYYAAAETVFIELIQAIERNTRIEFKNRYRGLDILLLDDIHYLIGKERLQEEIFHIFNYLHDSGSQVVFTSDRPPREIPTLQERLVSRLGSGLVVDLQPPDLETRIAILKRRAAAESIELPDDVCYYIASKVRTNVRALEGSLVRLLAMTSFQGKQLTLDLTKSALTDILPVEPRVDSRRVIEVVAEDFGVTPALLCGHSRTQELVLARQVAMFFMRDILSQSLKEIGRHFGGRDHTTVLHALNKVQQLRAADPAFAAKLSTLRLRITGEQNH